MLHRRVRWLAMLIVAIGIDVSVSPFVRAQAQVEWPSCARAVDPSPALQFALPDRANFAPFHLTMMGTTDPSTEPSSQPTEAPTTAAPTSWALPFMAEEARHRGYAPPLPFGFSPIYNYTQRDVNISDLRIGLTGAKPESVSHFVDVGSRAKVTAAI